MNSKHKYLFALIIIHVFVILGLLLYFVISNSPYQIFMLRGDSYYEIAEKYVQGSSMWHQFRGPIVPAIYTILFIFPHGVRPFIRLLISLIFSIWVILMLHRITRDYISDKQFFVGALIFVCNPVYNHWMFRPYPEIFLAFFLGLLILFAVKYFRTNKIYYLIYSSIVMFLSFFIKPVFLFVPVFLLLASMLIRSRKLAAFSVVLVIIAISGFITQDVLTRKRYDASLSKFERKLDYQHKALLITTSYWTDYVLKTKQFYKPTLKEYTIDYKDGMSLQEYKNHWIKAYFHKYPNSGLVFMNLYFIYSEPWLVFQKLLMSPLFFFAMSARTLETFVNLAFSIFSVILSVMGLKTLLRNLEYKKEIIIIISIVVGYISLHLVTHAMNRYSFPILPYLYIWGSIPLSAGLSRLLRHFKEL